MHLSPEECVDIVEGVGAEASEAHVRACATCREALDSVREGMALAAEAHVPEPSPLFWGHLSARVHEAVAAEEATPRGAWINGWRVAAAWMWPGLSTLGAVTAVALAVYVTTPRTGTLPVAAVLGGEPSGVLGLQPFGAADDPSLALVAELTEQLEPDAATETGLSNHVGGIDEAVGELSDSERVELQRLLKEALGRSGA